MYGYTIIVVICVTCSRYWRVVVCGGGGRAPTEDEEAWAEEGPEPLAPEPLAPEEGG